MATHESESSVTVDGLMARLAQEATILPWSVRRVALGTNLILDAYDGIVGETTTEEDALFIVNVVNYLTAVQLSGLPQMGAS